MRDLSSSFTSPSEFRPAKPSRAGDPPAPLMDFRSLQHLRARRSTRRGASQPRSVPPPGFDYPRGGLLPPSPCRLCFAPAALLGFTLRSFLLPAGIQRVSARMDPPTVSPAGSLQRTRRQRRPDGPQFLGFDPAGSPLTVGQGGEPAYRRMLPWVSPRRGLAVGSLGRAFAQPPLTRFAAAAGTATAAGAPGFRSASASSHPRVEDSMGEGTTLRGFSRLRGSRSFGTPCPGLWVHLTPRRALLPTADDLWEQARSYQS
jgi:hypothetical protein